MRIFGDHEPRTIEQLERCVDAAEGSEGVLCADGHVGYSQPIGGVVAYREHLSPSGVGYDIGCGNKAVLTDVTLADVQADLPRIMDEVFTRISFGVGRNDGRAGDHPVIDEIRDAAFAPQRQLSDLAAKQLGTVGAGNHYVDLFADEQDRVWIGVHFGSRGFGHKTASGFLALAQGLPFDARAPEGEMDSPPVLLHADSELGAGYAEAMTLAGRYAYAGRDVVCAEVLPHPRRRGARGGPQPPQLRLARGARRRERLGRAQGCDAGVPRPARLRRRDDGRARRDPRRRGIRRCARGALLDRPRRRPRDVAYPGRRPATPEVGLHGLRLGPAAAHAEARRLPAVRRRRQEALGADLRRRDRLPHRPEELATQGIQLRGGAADEAPGAYKRLSEVLAYHEGTVRVLHTLRPVGVAMAGADTFDPYKD